MEQFDIKNLTAFLESSPTAFHVVKNISQELTKAGFVELTEAEEWKLEQKGKYYVTRNGSAIIAFVVPEQLEGFNIIASHSDSPCFKLKENPELEAEGHYIKLNVEKYGGMLMAPWFDRPLSIAGKVMVKTQDGVKSKLVNIEKDLLMLPSLAIHMNREANDGYKYNVQKDMLPTFGDIKSKGELIKLVAENVEAKQEDILAYDLYVYNRQKSTVWGAQEEYLSAVRLDDLECVYTSMFGFLQAEVKAVAPIFYVADNEEVGSSSRQGAASTFLKDTLLRIVAALGKTENDYLRYIANSFMLSADNAHAVHPNYGEKSCPSNKCFMNEGVVIKYSANQKYTTDGVSGAVVKMLCDKANVPYQIFTNRSDMAGGSTLGNISTNNVPVKTADIGLAQLAMHSPYETAGVKDAGYMAELCKLFYETHIIEKGDSIKLI